MPAKLTTHQHRILSDVANGREIPHAGKKFGFHTKTGLLLSAQSLVRRGLLTEAGQITAAGRRAIGVAAGSRRVRVAQCLYCNGLFRWKRRPPAGDGVVHVLMCPHCYTWHDPARTPSTLEDPATHPNLK